MKRLVFGSVFFISVLFAGCGLLVEEGRDVLARVGGEPVRLDDLLTRIRTLPFEQRAKTNDSDQAIRMESRRSVLEEIIIEKLLMEEAKSRNVMVSDEEVARALQQSEEGNSQTSEFTEGIEGSPVGHEHAHEKEAHSKREIQDMRLQLMVRKMLHSELNEVARRAYYDGHPQEFSVSPPLVVCELLVVDLANESAVKKISGAAERDNTTLTEALAKLPDTPPVVFCGQLPPIPPNKLVPAMREKLEGLPEGRISAPFYLDSGEAKQYAVARFIKRLHTVPYENVREAINKKLYDSFLQELHRKYEVVYFQDKLDYRLKG